MIQAVRGTKDVLPDSISKWHFVEQVFKDVSSQFSYKELRTPIFEKTEVFARGIGEGTDVVGKEMYTFNDKAGESITLRPEMTAALVRSVIENSLLHESALQRLWYFGQFFRYERPQKGRLRQFHQYGAECLGSPFPESDVEVLLLADALFKGMGIEKYNLYLNTLGSDNSRVVYRQALVDYLQSIKSELSEQSQIRLEQNPLRVLDSKDEKDIRALQNAPVILDFLDDESKEHFDSVQNQLNALGLQYTIKPQLVRGLDYYCHTVFEFQSEALGSQDSFGGGGRYNGLFQQLGGKSSPAVGFALGVERMLLILESLGKFEQMSSHTDVFVCVLQTEFVTHAMKITNTLRNKGLTVSCDLMRRSFKAQMREANRLNSKFAIILGEEEINSGVLQIKNLSNSQQESCTIDGVSNFLFKSE